ncbi:hypothetical protein BJV82DRAFT_630904 [Fennellomyces sp. T-0311]|nr:hypothetical protein BJV82DRAFT_630904 [Fennellomyces sp. T-0311]
MRPIISCCLRHSLRRFFFLWSLVVAHTFPLCSPSTARPFSSTFCPPPLQDQSCHSRIICQRSFQSWGHIYETPLATKKRT